MAQPLNGKPVGMVSTIVYVPVLCPLPPPVIVLPPPIPLPLPPPVHFISSCPQCTLAKELEELTILTQTLQLECQALKRQLSNRYVTFVPTSDEGQ
jgi:hypothetical protein